MNEIDRKIDEYKILSNIEIETTKFRYTNFTAILSISFILPGLAIQAGSFSITFFETTILISKLVFLLGFVFYLFAVFHYRWFHRYSHYYRKRLKELEKEIGFTIYQLRKRPQFKRIKFHFEWALYLIGLVYFVIAGFFVGWLLFLIVIGVLFVLYMILAILTIFENEEPLEK
jgi:hypothetical protein